MRRWLGAHCDITQAIHNGVDVDAIPFSAAPGRQPSLLFAGRISPEKGVEDALKIAEQSGLPLALAGDIYDTRYYEQRIAPRLERMGERVRYLGRVPREEFIGSWARRGRFSAHHTGRSHLGWWRARRRRRARLSLAIGAVGWWK